MHIIAFFCKKGMINSNFELTTITYDYLNFKNNNNIILSLNKKFKLELEVPKLQNKSFRSIPFYLQDRFLH